MQKIPFKVTMIQVYICLATQGLSELQLQIKVSVKKWKPKSTIFFNHYLSLGFGFMVIKMPKSSMWYTHWNFARYFYVLWQAIMPFWNSFVNIKIRIPDSFINIVSSSNPEMEYIFHLNLSLPSDLLLLLEYC